MNGAVRYVVYDSPIGVLLLAERAGGLLAVRFPHETAGDQWERVDRLSVAVVEQMDAYFAGRTKGFSFSLPMAEIGTAFQRAVWDAVSAVPFGERRGYGQLACDIAMPDASRAVGAANGANPRPIVVPCHRIVGSTGKLTGYAGGLTIKRALLDHEAGVSGGGLWR